MTHIQSDILDFHLPLSAATYNAIYTLAKQRHQSATQMARLVIEDWLKQQATASLHKTIADYAMACAGTIDDLDEEMESAGLEQLSSLR